MFNKKQLDLIYDMAEDFRCDHITNEDRLTADLIIEKIEKTTLQGFFHQGLQII